MALQSVRQCDLDLTPWLEFFTLGLATQLDEAESRGVVVIRADVLSQRHALNSRQRAILRELLFAEMTVGALQEKLPAVPRRTLQRDLSLLEDKGQCLLVIPSRTVRPTPSVE